MVDHLDAPVTGTNKIPYQILPATTLLHKSRNVYDRPMATLPDTNLITADQFLQMDFGPDIKAELDNGIIRVVRMMAGGSIRHSCIQNNLGGMFWAALKGSRCHAHGPDMAVIVNDFSVRYPDLLVLCGKDSASYDRIRAVDDPTVVVEILSPTTASIDNGTKLDEYKSVTSIQSIFIVSPEDETVRVLTRTGPQSWLDSLHNAGGDIQIAHLDITLVHADIFAR